jgi:predicted ATP-binding protein involved in virulence
MIIQKVKMRHYRNFQESSFQINPGGAVITSHNGGGKTSFLHAIRSSLSPYVTSFGHGDGKHTLRLTDRHGDAMGDDKTSASITCLSSFGGELIESGHQLDVSQETVPQPRWDYSTPRTETSGKARRNEGAKQLTERAKVLSSDESPEGVLPLIRFFGVERIADTLVFSLAAAKKLPWDSPVSRFDGYAKALDGNFAVTDLLPWCKRILGDTPRSAAESIHQKSIKDLLWSVLDTVIGKPTGWGKPVWRLDEEGFLALQREDGMLLPLEMVGGSAACMTLLVIDLVRRSCTLNPHLGADAPSQTPGVVMIDMIEIKIALPWQTQILITLQSAFPKLQFIVTTTSPALLASLPGNQVIDLDRV